MTETEAFARAMRDGFVHLSIGDLLAAREQYHVFLTNHPNVVATAIGRYLIRRDKVDPKAAAKPVRTLANSRVDREKSWPCVLVFVDKWQSENDLLTKHSPGAVIPKTLYLPNGKAVPVCVVEAARDFDLLEPAGKSEIRFPKSVVAGGCPLVVDVQGRQHVATFGCLVTDGNKTYALTNRHVCGEPGHPVYAKLAGDLVRIGASASKDLQLSKLAFSDVYPGWSGANLFINADVGLVEIDDLNRWRTEVLGAGALGPMVDMNVNNLTLAAIGEKVQGYGARSGPIGGEISALFYRYRSMGGMEYVADYLIGPGDAPGPVVRHGDSGAVLLLQTPSGMRPFAVTWGAHEFVDNSRRRSLGFGLATGLGNVCRLLDVDVVRGWNIDQPYTWGKTGHFKVGFRAADLVSDATLAQLLSLNQDSLGYSNQDLEAGTTVGGTFTHDFVPLADVADIIWRSTRPDDESNHFCDIDETDPGVFGGKSILELSLADPANIDVEVWLDFDQQMDAINPIYKKNKAGKTELRPREGALPFRVWQMYKQMIESLRNGRVDEFLVAGGTMAHYTGDACQPLHISYLHHGEDPTESGVHSDYETNFIDRKAADLFAAIDANKTKVKKNELIGPDGKDAARLILDLMKTTVDLLPPEEILDVWRKEKGQGKYDRFWDAFGDRTAQLIANGAHTMAILWQSAWVNGDGAQVKKTAIKKIPQAQLQALYNNKNFVKSFRLSNTAGYKSVL